MQRTRLTVLAVALLGAVVVSGSAIALSGIGGSDGPQSGPTDIQFRERALDVGFNYTNDVPYGFMSNAGVYAADYDADGWTDLLAVGGERTVLFSNDGGQFSRTDQLAGVEATIRAAIFIDYDADGWTDLLLFPDSGEPMAFHNDGGTLSRTDVGLDVDLDNPTGASSGDYDGDGCLDLFVIQNGDWRDRLPEGRDRLNVSLGEDNGNPNYLFRGTCGGFVNATEGSGIKGQRWSLATSMVDFDDDGRPDIHVANDFNRDVLYWNEGNGTFTRAELPTETDRNGMASEVEDFTGDGRLDLFVTNIYYPENYTDDTTFVGSNRSGGNNLLVNGGDRRFSAAAEDCGVGLGGWGWATVGGDLDNDGDTDIYHATMSMTAGLGLRVLDLREMSPVYSYPALFEHQDGGDCSFAARNASRSGFEQIDGRGVSQVDFDRDGDLDIAVAVAAHPNQERYRLYENVGATGRALQVRLDGNGTTALGSRVSVRTAAGTQTRLVNSKTDYFSQDARVLHFGLANQSRADVRVVWPDGDERIVKGVEAGQRVVISRNGAERTIALDGPDSWLPPSAAEWIALTGIGSALLIGVALAGYWRYGRRTA